MKPRLPIPTGLHHAAQGCRVGEATLGHRLAYFPNLNGVASPRAPSEFQIVLWLQRSQMFIETVMNTNRAPAERNVFQQR